MQPNLLFCILLNLSATCCSGNGDVDHSEASCGTLALSSQGSIMLQKAPPSINMISNGIWADGRQSRHVTKEEWENVVNECCLASTDLFVRELLPQMNLQICDEGCHNGIIPFWDCKRDVTFEGLQDAIRMNSYSECPCYGTLGECQPFPQQCLERNTGEFNPYWHRRRACRSATTTSTTTTMSTVKEVECTPGFYHTSPQSACIECSGYTRRRRADSCTDCNAHRDHHHLYPVSNQDSCSPEIICNGGYYHKSALAPCIECAGSARRRRSRSCTECPTGRHNTPDHDDCDPELECHAGFFLAPPSLLQHGKSEQLRCTECDGSTRRRRAGSCTECARGTYTLPHKDNCQATTTTTTKAEVICESGYYHDSLYEACTECVGSARRRRADACTSCGSGELDVEEEDNCELTTPTTTKPELICDVGFYHDSPYEACKECVGSARRRRADSCTTCGDTGLGVVDEDDCEVTTITTTKAEVICEVGYYHTSLYEECAECVGSARRRRADSCTNCDAGDLDVVDEDNCETTITTTAKVTTTTTTTTRAEVICAPGDYHDSPFEKCNECVGSARRRRADACTNCDAGSIDAVDEDDCEATTTTTTTTTIVEVVCAEGYFHEDLYEECDECVGSSRRRRADSCTNCDAGSIDAVDKDDCEATTTTTTRAEVICAEGYFHEDLYDECDECVGSARRRRAASCTACDSGDLDVEDEDDCKTEVLCDPGMFHTTSFETCTTCSGSARRRRSDSCSNCPAGQLPVAGQDDCKAEVICSAGMWHQTSFATCTTCSGSARRRRSNQCSNCPAGQLPVNGQDDCRDEVICSAGMWHQTSFATCTTCSGSARRRRSNQCSSCPAGQLPVNGQDDCRDEVICSAGMWHQTSFATCTTCSGSARRRRSNQCSSCPSGEVPVNGQDDCQAPSGGPCIGHHGDCRTGTTEALCNAMDQGFNSGNDCRWQWNGDGCCLGNNQDCDARGPPSIPTYGCRVGQSFCSWVEQGSSVTINHVTHQCNHRRRTPLIHNDGA